MVHNRLKDLLAAGKPAIGAQLRFGSPAIAELFGYAGYDWLVIDTEHAPQTPPGVQAQIQAIAISGATPVVRISKIDEEQIRLYLDMGAMGIMAAMVSRPEEAKTGAQACRYPPEGTRGWGPHRAAKFGLEPQKYTTEIAPDVVFIPLIETAEAVTNIDAILAVSGVDTFVIGAVDLSFSVGSPFDYESEQFREAQDTVLAAAARAGIPAGGGILGSPTDPQALAEALAHGFRTILIGGDEPLLADSCSKIQAVLSNLRE